MVRRTENENADPDKTRRFIDKNWQKALIVAGAAGAIGAAVWLTARYLREKKNRETMQEHELKIIEKEVEAGSDQAVVLLETGTYLGNVAGDEGNVALAELSEQMEDRDGKEALEILRDVIDIDKR